MSSAPSSVRQKATAAAAKVGKPLVARIRAQVLAEVRPEVDAAHEEAARARAEVEAVRAELTAEIELLRAELDGRAP